ncbi:hypothetical protein, partial [Aeromonas hydrophila]|uniref:hypothetical protein n=1 Tax=Aeromonas hydrophila TaxID=644 RepID=UPI003F675364
MRFFFIIVALYGFVAKGGARLNRLRNLHNGLNLGAACSPDIQPDIVLARLVTLSPPPGLP